MRHLSLTVVQADTLSLQRENEPPDLSLKSGNQQTKRRDVDESRRQMAKACAPATRVLLPVRMSCAGSGFKKPSGMFPALKGGSDCGIQCRQSKGEDFMRVSKLPFLCASLILLPGSVSARPSAGAFSLLTRAVTSLRTFEWTAPRSAQLIFPLTKHSPQAPARSAPEILPRIRNPASRSSEFTPPITAGS